MIIILLGYMASGKSHVGKRLARQLNYDFIDLDDHIEQKESLSIADIFDSKGEIYFRAQENKYLGQILEDRTQIVLALGGGTPCYANNLTLILTTQKCISIYLSATIPTIVARLKNEKEKRPLISHITKDDDLTEFVGKHVFERMAYYNQAQFTIATDDKKVEDITEEIVLQLF